MDETAKTLREKPGADLIQLKPGTFVWVETIEGVYRIMVAGEAVGRVMVESNVLPLRAGRPMCLILERSVYDDRGKVFVMHWIGQGMKMLFRGPQGSFLTKSVESAKVEAHDGSWSFELWV